MNKNYKSMILKRIQDTLPQKYLLILHINNFYHNREFKWKELSERLSFIKQDVLRNYLSELKKEGLLSITKKGPKNWVYIATKNLFKKAKSIEIKLKSTSDYLDEIPSNSIKLRGNLRLIQRGIHLEIYSGILAKNSRLKEIYCKIFRCHNYFFIKPSDRGNKLISRNNNYSVEISIPKYIIYEPELSILNKKSLPVEIYITPNEWSLKLEDFFTESKFNRELVKSLSSKFKINVLPSHNYKIYDIWRFDVLLEEGVIEISAYNPKTKGGPHSTSSSVIRSKILDGLLYSLENKKPSIM